MPDLVSASFHGPTTIRDIIDTQLLGRIRDSFGISSVDINSRRKSIVGRFYLPTTHLSTTLEKRKRKAIFRHRRLPTMSLNPSNQVCSVRDVPVKHAAGPATPDRDWKHYINHRPAYPDSMWQLWLAYHKGPLLSAHDIGTGSGNAAESLLVHTDPRLERVVLTDPREPNIQDSQNRFAGRFPATRFVYRVRRGEDAWDDLQGAVGKVDFVMACESIHWTDLEPTMKNIAGGLRPGGTFAAVLYWPFPSITNNAAASEAFQRLIANHVDGLMKNEWMSQAWQRGSKQLNMDCVPLRDEAWEDVRRFYLNCGRGWAWEQHPEERDWHAAPVAHLGKHERIDNADCGDWKLDTNVQWLRGNLESLRFGFTAETWDSKEWKEIQDAVGDGVVKLEWQVQMVLARKR